MARKRKSIEEMSRDELVNLLNVIALSAKEAWSLVDHYDERARELEEAGNFEAAYSWRMMSQASDSVLKKAQLERFKVQA